MSNNHFPLRVVAYDASGVARNVSNLNDIVELAREKANDHGDAESQRYLKEHEADAAKIAGYDALTAKKATATAKPVVTFGKSAKKPEAKATGKSTGKKATGKK